MKVKIRLTEEEKIKIITLSDRYSFGKIAEELKKPRSTVSAFLFRWKRRKSIINSKPGGRKKKLNHLQIKKLITFIRRTPLATRRKAIIDLDLNCNVQTVS